MEIQNTLSKKDVDILNDFQLKIWSFINPLLKNLDFNNVSNKSSIEKGLGIDIFLKLNDEDIIIYFAINAEVFYVNSRYFDFYLYPEVGFAKIQLLIKAILSGNYIIIKEYSKKYKLFREKIIFNDSNLDVYNEVRTFSIFNKQVCFKEEILGLKIVNDSYLL